ncbi:MAG: mechanosensitive ion channel family protein [archaeon]
MVDIYQTLRDYANVIVVTRTIILIVILAIVFGFIISRIKRALLKRTKSKKYISNIKIFSRLLYYLLVLVLILVAVFSLSGDYTGLGITVGLLSAALGWALQKPITGIAAWIMIIVKRPFRIGDRVIIGNIKGDVYDITITHIYLSEVGGLMPGEETSGRVVMVPNSLLFDMNIINYTLQDDFVLDQVNVSITYESDLDKAIKIALDSAKKILKEIIEKTKKEPYVRTFFEPSNMGVRVRYFVPADRLQEFSSAITKEIFDRIRKEKDVEIAYPHSEVVFRKK